MWSDHSLFRITNGFPSFYAQILKHAQVNLESKNFEKPGILHQNVVFLPQNQALNFSFTDQIIMTILQQDTRKDISKSSQQISPNRPQEQL